MFWRSAVGLEVRPDTDSGLKCSTEQLRVSKDREATGPCSYAVTLWEIRSTQCCTIDCITETGRETGLYERDN